MKIIKKLFILLICILSFFCVILLTKNPDILSFLNNDTSEEKLEKNIVSSLVQIEKNNKKYLANKELEDKNWDNQLKTISSTATTVDFNDKYIVGVGDSVFLAAIDELKKVFPNSHFDGKVSRTLTQGIPILKKLKDENKLGDTIIIGLATNGDFIKDKCTELMKIVENRTVYWVNSVGADDPKFNEKFEEFAKDYPNIHIIRWDKKAENHKEYFYDDGIHTKDAGIKAYKEVVYETIYNDYLKQKQENEENNKIINEHSEETNKRIAFYGNDLLINSYKLLNKNFNNSIFNAKRDYSFDELYKDLTEKINNKELEYNLVFMFDSSSSISIDEYKKIIELCKEYKIYIVNINQKNFVLENVTVIDLYSKLERRKDYIMGDKIHLTSNGNKYLVKSLIDIIK